jgi:OmcA/MtrC family decaheme c-type cytochrome
MLALATAAAATSVALAGCAGDDGAAGKPGVPGEGGVGQPGDACTVTEAGDCATITCPGVSPVTVCGKSGADGGVGTCTVADNPAAGVDCKTITCSDGTSETVCSGTTPETPTPLPGQGLNFEVTQVSNSGGALSVTFTFSHNGNPITNLTMAPVRIMVNQYHPAANTYDSSIWSEDHLYERDTTPGADSRLVQDPKGTYTYTFLETIQEAITNDGADPALVQQVAIRISGFENYHPVNFIYQITGLPVNDGDVATKVAAPVGNIVETSACETCHGPRLGNVGHGGGYNKVEYCRNCHTSASTEMATKGRDLMTMIHQIHAAIGQTKGGTDWSDVTYPQNVNNCAKCHKGVDGDNWNTLPTAQACGSCHVDVNFATGANHVGGIQTTNAMCAACHSPATIRAKHATASSTPNNPDVPAGAANFSYVINSVTMAANGTDATINFAILKDGVAITDLHTTFPPTGFTGGPAFLFAYALPQDGIAAPADWNNLGRNQAQPASVNVSALTLTAGASGTFNAVHTNAFPAGATMRAVALQGYFTQTSLSLARQTPSVVKGVTGDAQRRAIVNFSGCLDCHERLSLHGGNRVLAAETDLGSVPVCTMCHNPNLSSSGNTMDTAHANWTANTSTLATRAKYGDDPFAWPEASQSFKDLVHGIHAEGYRTTPYEHVRMRQNNAYYFDWSHITFPGDPSNCSKCHVGDSYSPEKVPAGALMTTKVTGTPSTRAEALAVRASVPNANDSVFAPIAGACHGCHDSGMVTAHMNQNGAMLGAARSVVAPLAKFEQCSVCHDSGSIADVAKMHSGLNP